ncbi:MAG: hypothetical protein ACI4VW_01735 [Acutalibacteraceae bacterium]
MGGSVKLKSKMLIRGDTLRLFFVGVFGFTVRAGTILLWLYSLVTIFKSGVINSYLENYNSILVYSLVFVDIIFVTAVLILFVSALRLGEQFLYFIKANGGKGRFPLLFRFFTFKKSIKAFSLYARLTFLKGLWFIYYSFPCAICYGITLYLYSNGSLLPAVYYVLIAGSSVLLSYCVFMWRVTFFRYNAAAYYICLNNRISPRDAIKKSVYFTDGFLKEYALTESSFLGWFLSCILIVPIVYVLPYFKVTKALFVTESVGMKATSKVKTDYAINYLRIK